MLSLNNELVHTNSADSPLWAAADAIASRMELKSTPYQPSIPMLPHPEGTFCCIEATMESAVFTVPITSEANPA